MNGAEHEILRDNVLRAYDAATPDQRARGAVWYMEANRVAYILGRTFDVSTHAAAGVIAALSPQRAWERNVIDAFDTCEFPDVEHVHYARNMRKAWRALNDLERLGRILRGPKERAFAACILRPTNRVAVCVDRWAARAAAPEWGIRVTSRRYRAIAAAYRAAARERGVSPAVLQATVWLQIRA